jgi:capsular polysaccharide export protein
MKKIFMLNISRWKRRKLKPFFPNNKLIFVNSVEGLDSVTVWGNQKLENTKIQRIEDGFIRSVSLGVDFSQPYSLIVDKRGIYFDATKESDLEHILSTYLFDEKLLKRANNIQNYLVQNRLSKYNLYRDNKIELKKETPQQKTILVIGQVEGDASLIYGANNMKNIELLKYARGENSKAYILYKPHPDVLNGNRLGNIKDDIALQYCNHIEKEVSVDSLLEIVDEVHTMTSLVGFEALLRGKKVVCYGLPFYAGWGLTVDKKHCERRKRVLTLSQLIAGTYILYPKYIDPINLKICEIERVLEALSEEKRRYHHSAVYRSKVKIKNFIYIKYYALLRHLLKD